MRGLTVDAAFTLLANTPFSGVIQVVIGLLAVGGAFLCGYIFTWILLGGICRFCLRRQMPRLLMTLCRILGGLTFAVLVAMFVFGDGGFGFGPGNAQKGDTGINEPKEEDPLPDPKETVPEPKPKEEFNPQRVQITILGGVVDEERFYLFEDDRVPKTFTEIQRLIRERKRSSSPPLNIVEIYVYKNSADRLTAVVTRLEFFAKSEGLGVSYPPVSNQNRPE